MAVAPRPLRRPIRPIENLMQTAIATAGATAAKKCAACHNFVKGAGPKVGPDLYGVLDRDKSKLAAGFKYFSAADQGA